MNLFAVLIITGSFACSLAFWQRRTATSSRCGRRASCRGCSADARDAKALVATVVVLPHHGHGPVRDGRGGRRPAEAWGAVGDPLTALFQIGTWMPFQGNMMLFPLMALVNLELLVYFLREGRDGFHWFKTFVAPILGSGALAFGVFLMLKNRAALTTGVYEGWTKAIPYYSLGIFSAAACSPSSTAGG
jgi:hypothetical protein